MRPKLHSVPRPGSGQPREATCGSPPAVFPHVSMLSRQVVMQTPLKFRTTSVPTTGKFFRVEDVNKDLVVELHDATIEEGLLTDYQSHFILDICTKLSPHTTQNLLSTEDSLKIRSLILKNEYLYRNGRWEPTKIPKILRSADSSQHYPPTSPSTRDCSSRMTNSSQAWRGRPSAQSTQQANSRKGIRIETVHRCIARTSQEESVKGIFIPVAGTEEQQVADWLNDITCALEPFISLVAATSNRVLTRSTAKPLCSWTSETAKIPVKDNLMPWKPDVILREKLQVVYGPQPEFSWKYIISFIELSSSAYGHSSSSGAIRNAIIRKAYAIFASQPNRRFVFALSIADQKFRAHMFDRSGAVHSRGYDIHRHPRMLLCMLSILAFSNVDQVGYDPTFLCQYRSAVNLRKIQVAHSTYDIVKCIFYNFLIHGRGTSCWHVRFKKKDYVIKDSWIHASRVNREMDILEMIKDLRGVPRFIAAWTVEIGGSSDRTDIRRPILR